MPNDLTTDARTTPSAVWKMVEHLRGDELAAWRMADLPNRRPAEERNLTEPFPFGWYVVCYSVELAIGEVKPVRYFARDLVIWRGEDGQARVLDAYCRHLGANMGYGGRVAGNDLECPFHAWTYDGTGAVTAIPYARRMPPRAQRAGCVRAWPVVERNGMVWVWYHPEGAAPLWEVDVYPEVGAAGWTPLEWTEWRVFNTIRNMHDNTVDPAHFLYVHRMASFPETETVIEGHVLKSITRAKLGTPKGVVNGEIVVRNMSPGQGSTRFLGISETLLLTSLTPVEKDEVHTRFTFTQPEAEAKGPMGGLARALVRDICKQFDQDKTIWDRQRYEPRPMICDGDGPIPMARALYDQFLSDEAFARAKGNMLRVATSPNAVVG
jgi:phenylpropionate dioxygenase-like ring-hydroxylating dioxygenase large terminal subunit